MRPREIPIEVVWQADRLADQVFALWLGLMAAGAEEKKRILILAGGRGGDTPSLGVVRCRNRTVHTDFLQKTYLGIYE